MSDFTKLSNQIQLPTPVSELGLINGVQVFVKRDDLTHPEVSGNKWRKLKRNLEFCLANNYKGVISFGGAFSNHIYSLSAACSIVGLPFAAIIRGEEVNENNSTLKVLAARGQKIFKISREEYQKKSESKVVREVLASYPEYYLIPEGGTNKLGIEGMQELVDELMSQCPDFDYLVCSAGTFGTSAGIFSALPSTINLVVYPALIGKWVHEEINKILSLDDHPQNLMIRDEYHFGGYGTGLETMKAVIDDFYIRYGFTLDPVYTSKAFYGMFEDINKGFYKNGSTVIFYHSGGLQGLNAQK